MALTERTPSGIIYVDSNGVSHNVKAVYRGSTKVRPEGGGGGWTPGEHTVAYYPFKEDFLDYSGNDNHWTTGTGTFANNMVTTTTNVSRNPLITDTQQYFTLVAWADFSKTTATNGYAYISIYGNTDGPTCGFWINRTTNEFAGFKAGNWYTFTSTISSAIHCLGLTRNGSIWSAYVDGELIGTKTVSGGLQYSVISRIGSPNGYTYSITCGNMVVEDVARTDQEVADFYDLTKGDYGL